MVLKIISLICTVLCFLTLVTFVFFVIFKLRKIDSQLDSILKHYCRMGIYMNDILQTEQNNKRLGSVPLKIYEKSKYLNIPIPRKGEEINGVYYSGEDCFILSLKRNSK